MGLVFTFLDFLVEEIINIRFCLLILMIVPKVASDFLFRLSPSVTGRFLQGPQAGNIGKMYKCSINQKLYMSKAASGTIFMITGGFRNKF